MTLLIFYTVLKIALVCFSIWLLYKAKDGNWDKVLPFILLNLAMVIIIRMME